MTVLVSEATAGNSLPVETFAGLVNRRILIPSERTHYVAVDRFFLASLMRDRLARIRVDETWYKTFYPDIAAAIAEGVVSSSRDHYIRFGYYEHRMPYPIEVDEEWYLDQYPDVREAIRNDDFQTGQAHFQMAGFREGRFP
ncbi:MAG TPA: hypothetical protein VME92_16180, partial [Acetobacteraceae bacterium]|nr:hypothetical protein [Acetobacteraceae bacterium]